MSTATRDAITEAIRNHAEDEWNGDLIIDWVVTAATIDSDGDYAPVSYTHLTLPTIYSV